MAVFSISYDLQSTNYDPLIEAIKSYGFWWHQSKSTWFIQSDQTAREILENLKNYIQIGDKLIFVRIHQNWWATGHTNEEYEWMKNRTF